MNFTHYDLGQKSGGEIIEVTLSNAANVRLMDSSNFQNYKNGRKHRYYGGYVTKAPVRLTIPSSGSWHLTVDLGGHAGSVKSSIRILSGSLPVFREPSLSSVPSLIQSHNDTEELYDVFISHASEDKDEVARPLSIALEEQGLKVWYDEFTLNIGDSLRRKIDRGLSSSKFGVIIFSNSLFRKGWTNYEVDGLVTRSVTGEQLLLPIWHKVTKQDVINYSPSLADKLARSTSTHTIQEIADEIAELIKNRKDDYL